MATTYQLSDDQIKKMGGDDYVAVEPKGGYVLKDGVPIKRVAWYISLKDKSMHIMTILLGRSANGDNNN